MSACAAQPFPKDLPPREPSQEHTHGTAGTALTSNSKLAAITWPCGCLGLLAASVLADCREAEVRGSSAKHWGIRQDGCGLTGASQGAPGRREQLHPCRDFSGMWALVGGQLLCVSWFMLRFCAFCFAKVLVWGQVSTHRAACAPQNSWQFCGRMALLSYQLGKLSRKGSSWPIPWGSQCCHGRAQGIAAASRFSEIVSPSHSWQNQHLCRESLAKTSVRAAKGGIKGFSVWFFLGRSPHATCL